MDRVKYLQICQRTSYKIGRGGAWWAIDWNEKELVMWKDEKYIPVDYRFGFVLGEPTHIAVINSLKTDCQYNVKLSEIEELHNAGI